MSEFSSSIEQSEEMHDMNSKEEDRIDALWFRADFQHNDTFLRMAAQVANWRKIAFIAMVIAGLAVGGVVYIGAQSKFVPMVIEVDKLGRTVAVRALTGDDAVTDSSRMVYREMFELVENLRTISTDRAANNKSLEKGFARLNAAALVYVKTELRKALPNEIGAMKTVQVQVKTALKLTDKSWQVEWEEHSFALNGEPLGIENWKATLSYELVPLGDDKSIHTNPIGFLVNELNWMKVI